MGRKRLLFWIPYPPGEAPSQRFRFEQYLPLLQQAGYQVELRPFLSPAAWRRLYARGHVLQKAWAVVAGVARRKWQTLWAWRYDAVFIHREAAPLGPPFFEWVVARLWRRRVIFDFDDAIWLPNTTRANRMVAALKWHGKTRSLCRWAWKVSAGNDYLADYARQAGATNVVVNPTTIDLQHHDRQVRHEARAKVSIGWTGSHSTLPYLVEVLPVLKELATQRDFRFVLVADKNPRLPLPEVEYHRWTQHTEVDDLLRMDIGLMPLPDNAWSRGKCGFKILQYFACGVPTVASPVGVNTRLIADGQSGFLADSPQEWIERLTRLIDDVALRRRLGQAGHARLQQGYTTASNSENFLALFAGL